MRPGPPTRRGALLLLIGLIYLLIGSYYAFQADIPASALAQYTFATGLLRIEVWGLVWASCGLVGIAAAFHRPWNRIGFAVLTGFSMLWGVMAFLSAISDGNPRAAIAGLIWTAWAGILMITSGMK